MGSGCNIAFFSEKLVHALVVQLKRVISLEETYCIMNIYMFDHKSGLPCGQIYPMRHPTEGHTAEENNARDFANTTNGQNRSQTNAENQDNTNTQSRADSPATDSQTLYVASKG